MVVLNSNAVLAPGTYISENTAGLFPAELASFNRCFMMGLGASGDYNTPTQVVSSVDFTYQFGSSASLESVKLFFNNLPNGVLFFTRVGAPGRIDITVATATAGSWSITLNTVASSYTAGSSDTNAVIATALAAAINNNSSINSTLKASALGSVITVETLAVGGSITLGTLTTPGSGTLTDSYYQYAVTLGTPAAGTWSLTINGTTVSYVAGAAPTLASIVNGLAAAIQANVTANALVIVESITGTGFTVRSRSNTTLITITAPTAPGGSTATAVASVAAPVMNQFIQSVSRSFDPDVHEQGFLVAPEAFSTLTEQSDRTSVALAMENKCAAEGFDWMALVDSGPSGTINTHAKAVTESANYTTARGHLAYFFPYLTSLENATVPPSAGVAALAIRRYRDQGFNQPPAGARYPINGVKAVLVKITRAEQEVGNPIGVNAIRLLPNLGIVVWGSRTRSGNPYYRFVNTRVILNVLIGTLRGAFDSEIFTAVDGQGVLFSRIRETAAAICYRMWDGGALYGAVPAEAFFVKCDRENNPAIDLEAGIVRMDVYVVPSPTMERLLISVSRTAIGQIEFVTKALGA